jgi:hypothetical protein
LTGACAQQGYLEATCQSILTNEYTNFITVLDVNRDGKANIMVGTSINGVLYNYVYEGADCSVDWTAQASGGWTYNTRGDVKSIAVGDMDNDGRNDVIVNSVGSNRNPGTTPDSYVYALIALENNYAQNWRYDKDCGFSNSVDLADMTGSGVDNVIMGTRTNRVCAIKDNRHDGLLWTYQAPESGMQVVHVEAADINANGKDEIIGLSSKYGKAYLIGLDLGGGVLFETEIQKGVQTGLLPSNIIAVGDINNDGKKEIIVGSSENGVQAYSSTGVKLWEYDMGNTITSVELADIDGDGILDVIAGSAPKIVVLGGSGAMKVEADLGLQTGTVYSISAYDIDGDGKKEIAVGTTGAVYVLDDDGSILGEWKYLVEIRAFETVDDRRNADAVAVYMADLDSDGKAEIVSAWNWEEGTIRGNRYSTTIRVFEIHPENRLGQATTTTLRQAEISAETTTTLKVPETTTTIGYHEDEANADESGVCCMPFLTALIALGAAVAGKIP